jgi:hypothetical protein
MYTPSKYDLKQNKFATFVSALLRTEFLAKLYQAKFFWMGDEVAKSQPYAPHLSHALA